MNVVGILDTSIKVKAFDFKTREFIGEYESMLII